jgi:sugar lactone lactonase YvrE
VRAAILFAITCVGCATAGHPIELMPDELPPDLRDDAREVATAYLAHPDDACVLYQVAALLARAGRRDDAIVVTRRMAALGSGVDPRLRDGFTSLAGRPDFEGIVASIRAANPPVVHARDAFSLVEGDLRPEGIAWSTTTERLYLGSAKRKIIAVDRAGHVEPFVEPATGGLGIVLGVRVDDARGELWAASVKLDGQPADAVTGLFRFRLADGAVIAHYSAGLVNDVAVAPDGRAYATLTATGTIARVDPATGVVDTLLPAGSIPDANGIAVSPDGAALFVASWHEIYRVDLATRRVRALRKSPSVASGCFDGLYVLGHDLVGVQNCVHATGRVMRLHLDPRGETIERATVLASYDPRFDGITTAAIAGDTLWFVANVQLRKHAGFDPLRVLALPVAP